jgi:hypothetical protein
LSDRLLAHVDHPGLAPFVEVRKTRARGHY